MGNHKHVYVDQGNNICTDLGTFLRAATPDEIEDGQQTEEGFIVVPDDLDAILTLDEDGHTIVDWASDAAARFAQGEATE